MATEPLTNAMEPAPVSPISEDEGSRRQKGMKNRHVSVYAARVKVDVPPFTMFSPVDHGDDDAPLPPMPPLPIAPRWDSLSNGPHLLSHTLSTGMTPPTQPAEQMPPLPISTPGSIANSIHRISNPSSTGEAFPEMTRVLTSKDSQSDIRSEAGSVGNFSRPRKPSNKQQLTEASNIYTAAMTPPDLSQSVVDILPQPAPWQRSRGPSISSFRSATSASTLASPNPLSPDHDNKLRQWTSPHALPGRPAFTPNSRVDSAQSAPGSAVGGSAPWMSGDELRSSFRSQLTTSTTPETTERSSVMTKDSSVSSVYATAEAETEEPSLEDVMGMYEKGFEDDSDDNDSGSEENVSSRPATAFSETGPFRRTIDVTGDMGSIPTIPEVTPKQLDAEIRQSKLIFSNPDFIATLPAIADGADDLLPSVQEVDDSASFTNRDSARSTASDPSPHGNTNLPFDASITMPATILPPSPLASSPVTIEPPAPAPAAPPTRPQFEDPGSRDRYGFKKESQFITRPQYDEWNKGYSQYLSRRRKKWVAYLKDSALLTDRPTRFPPPSAKTKRFVRKGIPPDWRGAAWFYYAGGPAILGKNSGLYVKLLQKTAKPIDVEAIERDLHRTFPDNIQFKSGHSPSPSSSSSERHSQSTLTGTNSDASEYGPKGQPGEPPIITSLRRVLHAFSVYNPKIGYCQSLNFLAGLLLLFVETEEHCFWLLNVITHIYLPGTHEMSLEGSKVDLGVLMTEIRDTMPDVWEKIGGELEGELARPAQSKSIRIPLARPRHRSNQSVSTERLPPITLCMTAWFMSCYIGTLPIETTLRVWDVFFYEGSKTLFRIAMAIFKQGEGEIQAVSDPMEMFGVVQSMPRKMLDANGLMELCFKRRNGFNHLNQDVIDDRRRERRDKARREQDTAQRANTGSGSTTDVERDVSNVPRRRATLFGRQRKRDVSRPSEVEA